MLFFVGCKDDTNDVQHDSHSVRIIFTVSNSVNLEAFNVYSVSGVNETLTATIKGAGTDSSLIDYPFTVNESLDEHPKELNLKVKPMFFSSNNTEQCDIATSLIVDDVTVLEIPTQTLKLNEEVSIVHTVD